MVFRPVVHTQLIIGGEKYFFSEHPVAKGIPYGQTGRRATVYQVHDNGDRLFALKIFTSAFRSKDIESNALTLQNFSSLPGLEVCSRKVITSANEPVLVRQYPDLEYAVLMPWAKGRTWQETMLCNTPLLPQESLSFPKRFSSILCTLEKNKIAHCDLSAPNLLISDELIRGATDVSISLVDVEDLYAEGLTRPQRPPAGSVGYRHRTAESGLWDPAADRFAGAILLAEMLTWCDDRVLRSAYGEQYFAPEDMQTDCKRYHTLYEVINELYGDAPAMLLESAWYSRTLADCPTFSEWQSTLQVQQQAARPLTPRAHSASAIRRINNNLDLKTVNESMTDSLEQAADSSPLQAPLIVQNHHAVLSLPWVIATVMVFVSIVLGIQLSSTNSALSGVQQGYYELSETVDIQSTQIADQLAEISDQKGRLSEQAATISDLEDLIESHNLDFALLQSMIPFDVGAREVIYGPESGELAHHEDDYVEFNGSETLNRRDFIARAVFKNPFSTDENSWDYGFLLRDTGGNSQYRLIIFSNQTWELSLYEGDSDGTLIDSGDLATLRTDGDATNEIVIAARGNDGYLFVNGSFVSWLDLSEKLSYGDVYIATGMYNGDEKAGKSTEFYDFTVWSLR